METLEKSWKKNSIFKWEKGNERGNKMEKKDMNLKLEDIYR